MSAPFGKFFLPGPTEVLPEILAAQNRPMVGHRGKETEDLLAAVAPSLRSVFRTQQPVIISTSSATGLSTSIFCEKIRSSISSSRSSWSLKPFRAKILMPLSWKGLWEAEITTPASARMLVVMKAIPGVGRGPTRRTSTPMEQMPAARAFSIM